MKNLFIIGNGFDIHHGINSRYSDYHKGQNYILSTIHDNHYNGFIISYVVFMILQKTMMIGGIVLNNIYLQLVLIILIGYIKIMVQYMEVKILVMLTITELPYN